MNMNKNIFCSRKGGATIKGKFYPMPRASQIVADQTENMAMKLKHRTDKREARKPVN